jgi:SAM-dependent methyltransferase
MEIGAGSRGSLIQMFGETNDVISIDKYLGALEQGYWKALKTFTRKLVFDPIFYHHLRKLNGGYLNRARKVINMDAMKMEFPDNDFDFVYSRYLLEHIEDISTLASEIHRVLKPGGRTYHVFSIRRWRATLDWRRHEPWQHLTEREGNVCKQIPARLRWYSIMPKQECRNTNQHQRGVKTIPDFADQGG